MTWCANSGKSGNIDGKSSSNFAVDIALVVLADLAVTKEANVVKGLFCKHQ